MGMNEMAKYPGLVTRNDTYQVRFRVPAYVHAAVKDNFAGWQLHLRVRGELYSKWQPLVGKRQSLRNEVSKSLKTKDRKEAMKRYHEIAAEFEDMFQSIKFTLAGEKRVATQWDAERIAKSYFVERDTANASSQIKISGDRDEIWSDIVADLSFAASDSEHSEIEYTRITKNLLAVEGFDSDPSSEGAVWLDHYIRRADIELGERSLSRLKGKHGVAINDHMFAGQEATNHHSAPDQEQKTFAEVFEAYVEEKELNVRSTKTVPGYMFLRRIIEETVGIDQPIRSYNREVCRRVRDVLMHLPAHSSKKKETRDLSIAEAAEVGKKLNIAPMSKTTANGYLSDLSAFFKWAVREDYLDKNPAEALTVGKSTTLQHRKRRSFTKEELVRIFNAPIYKGCKDDERGYAKPGPNIIKRSRYWVPLISLWTGMRLGEICQLEIADVAMHDGVPCIVTVWDAGDEDTDHSSEEEFVRSRKSKAAARSIPIHSDLVRMGFLEFVEEKRECGTIRLFPEIKPDSLGYLSGNYSKWFARFLAKVGVKTSRNCFHSFRHTYRDAMRKAKISRDTVVSIGGWTEAKTSDNYGDGFFALDAKRELDKITFDGLDLSHLYVD